METPVQSKPAMQNELPMDQRPLDFKEWALYIFLTSLPLVGIILLFVWAFSDSGNIHRKSWAKGMLLIALIGFVLMFVIFLIFGGVMMAALSHNS